MNACAHMGGRARVPVHVQFPVFTALPSYAITAGYPVGQSNPAGTGTPTRARPLASTSAIRLMLAQAVQFCAPGTFRSTYFCSLHPLVGRAVIP